LNRKGATGNGNAFSDLAEYALGLKEFNGRGRVLIGGSTQESNLPKEFLTPLNGFEDRADHQRPMCFQFKNTVECKKGLDKNLAL